MAEATTLERTTRRGTFANGMEYLTWGGGPKTLLFIPGGPGSDVPAGLMLRAYRRMFAAQVDAGFAVWVVTRCRHMRTGHTVADMADDYAHAITEDLGGKVDVILGMSYGGLIAQYLAAFHADRFEHIVVLAAGCDISEWGKDVDLRLATAIARGDTAGAGTALVEYALRGDRMRVVRRLLGPILGQIYLAGSTFPPDDVLIEAQAEIAFESRSVLPLVQVPVLLICGDEDLFFPPGVVEETADLIPDCTLIQYRGQGHLKTCTDKRVAHDVLAFVNRERNDHDE